MTRVRVVFFQCIFTGKRRCINDAAHILRVLSDLLGHENQEASPSAVIMNTCHLIAVLDCCCQIMISTCIPQKYAVDGYGFDRSN